jgi:hypothetical protein
VEERGEGQHGGPLVQARCESLPRVVQPARHRPARSRYSWYCCFQFYLSQ